MTTVTCRLVAAALAAVLWAHAPVSAQTAAAETPAQRFAGDVHARAGLTCATCHTPPGPPAAIDRTAIAPLCARCHSDGPYMQRFAQGGQKPQADQFALYQTTTHGRQMARGETRVATCSDCHRAHGVLAATDVSSSVAPMNVAATCARCHSDKTLMEPFGHFGDPVADWNRSVHAAALQRDSSAPTCATCHSPHGVGLEGAPNLQMVCAACHARESDLYLRSPHKTAFEAMDQPGCVTCHGNHEVVAPTAAMIGIDDPGICGACHDDSMKGLGAIKEVGQRLTALSDSVERARGVLDRAEVAGMLVDQGRLDLRQAIQQQILGRVALHTFALGPLADPIAKGLDAAARAEQAGHDALAEMQFRRRGLAVATLLILGFLVTLGIKIRRLPHPPS